MTVAAPTDVFQGDSVAAVDISTAVHSSPPRRQRISATAALRKSFSAVVNASRPFPTNPSARSPKGFMLYNASSRGHTHLVREYILGEVDVDWQDDLGFSSLLVASKKGHSQVQALFKVLLLCVWLCDLVAYPFGIREDIPLSFTVTRNSTDCKDTFSCVTLST
eukprot:6210421-Pleurochrysis_carterae.AAC.1